MSWLRLYSGVVHDPRFHKMPPELFRFWTFTLCATSENKGVIPSLEDLAFITRLPESSVIQSLEELKSLKLIDELEDGSLQPHNWNQRQYVSDSSTSRVKRHREKQALAGNVSETFHETALKRYETVPCNVPDQNRSDTDQNRSDTDQNRSEKKELEKKMKNQELFDQLPEEFNTKEVRSAWNSYLESRARAGSKPYTSDGLQILAKRMIHLSKDGLIEILEQAVIGGWKGIPTDLLPNAAGEAPRVSKAPRKGSSVQSEALRLEASLGGP